MLAGLLDESYVQRRIRVRSSDASPVSSGSAMRFAPRKLKSLRSCIDHDVRAIANLARQQLAPERGLQLALDHAPQRTCAINRIVAVLGQVVARLFGQL